MAEFTRSQLNLLRKQLQAALDAAKDGDTALSSDLSDINFEVGNCSYRGGEATFKVKVLMEGAKTREQEDLEYYAELYKLDLTKTARLMGEIMQLSGYKSRARKKPFILKRLRDGAEFVAGKDIVEKFFNKEYTHAE